MELEHRNITPLMQMTYAPVERRLDMAVFRSLFATSIRQARLMVVHGAVTVNGKKVSLTRQSRYVDGTLTPGNR
jgi:ribosomal protein S4